VQLKVQLQLPQLNTALNPRAQRQSLLLLFMKLM
jgi:hypothetical protein